MYSRSDRRTGRAANVKSGCRTCKIRKVKCDEDRPACRRCISTGRVCDGYGILGGAGSKGYFYSYRQRLTSSRDTSRVIFWPPASVSVLASSGTSEKGYFDWFRCRTVAKLPGSFVSSFWTTLLLQASVDEPAVLHAVLALSSVHRSGTIHADGGQSTTENLPTEQERFTLQHYVKAIGYLQPHFSAVKDRASFRVALITCVVFVCLDFLRGHFQTAQVHLQNGLKILGEMHTLLSDGDGSDGGVLHWKPCRESTDDWIVEAFSRLHLQVALFKHAYQHPCVLALQDPTPLESPPALLVFRSVNEAWRQMGRLLNKIFHLTHQCRQAEVAAACEPLRNPPTLLKQQQQIQTSLTHWLATYTAFEHAVPPGPQRSADDEKCYQLLYVYHTMAAIMAATCLRLPNDESIFDSHTNQFILLITQAAKLWTLSSTTASLVQAQSPPPAGQYMDMASSVVDMGWIPPLYYVAVKCRVHRVRLQAIRLLESTSHREGIWDAKMAACVARKIVEIEERDFNNDVDAAGDEFSLASGPSPRDLSLPTLPDSYRIRDVEVVLSGGPMDRISLFYRQKRDGGDCGVFLSEYSVRLQRWEDRGCG